MVLNALSYLLALPIDLLRVFGFENTARRIEWWFSLRYTKRMAVAIGRFGASAAQAAESARRLSEALHASGDTLNTWHLALAAREER